MPRRLAFILLASACGRAAPVAESVTIPGSSVAFDLAWIPEGGFWIGRCEVTWDEYLLYCAFDNPEPDGVDAVARPSKPLDTHPFDRRWGLGRRPAVGMSGAAAVKYCEWLSARTDRVFRLPTEQEWQIACGARPAEIMTCSWNAANSGGFTREVGTGAAGPHGLHDMLGNLWEYCGDGSVLRGGCWQDPPEALTPAARLPFDEDWVLRDPNFPPGVWWVPDGSHLGLRVLHPGPPPSAR